MHGVKEITDLKDKTVLLRTDFDVPIRSSRGAKEGVPLMQQSTVNNQQSTIGEDFRIKKQKPMVNYLLDKGAKVVMVAHISAIDSFEPILSQLEGILGHEINFLNDITTSHPFDKFRVLSLPRDKLQATSLSLVDNIRRWPGEKENDEKFAEQLARGFDLYVNNAFAVCHRNHASVSAVTKLLPSYAGFLIEEETSELEKLINSPKDGKLIIIGGAKAATKIPVIKNFLNKSEKIILGGVIANDILKERGMDIDASIVDENSKELLAGLDIYDERIILAEDFNAPDGKILDIGPRAIDKFTNLIKRAKMIIWNGPVGLFENPDYAKGTNGIAMALADSGGFRVIGGGDTITAVNKLGLLNKFYFVSTGGGAMLAFLAGNKLPGLEALEYYK